MRTGRFVVRRGISVVARGRVATGSRRFGRTPWPARDGHRDYWLV